MRSRCMDLFSALIHAFPALVSGIRWFIAICHLSPGLFVLLRSLSRYFPERAWHTDGVKQVRCVLH